MNLKIENYPNKSQYYKAVRLSFAKYDETGKIYTTAAEINFCPYCQQALEIQEGKRICHNPCWDKAQMSKIKQAHREEIKKYGECRIANCEKCLLNRQKEEECRKHGEEASRKAKELKAQRRAEKEALAKERSNKNLGKKRG
ncbi:10426_t:CDS:1 [Ambispora leptoticha]|uniref:10426_t:CDS:1 n=2 Tax=Ambispora leptoticha TaxID=144679 RepID=A0A9N9BUZ9_9GLOM|nr:10426_t:CDS:1 [Ambispora leptoticha]